MAEHPTPPPVPPNELKAPVKPLEKTKEEQEQEKKKAEQDKQDKEKAEKKAKEKAELLSKIQEVLHDNDGLESNIPMNSDYWDMVNRYRGL